MKPFREWGTRAAALALLLSLAANAYAGGTPSRPVDGDDPNAPPIVYVGDPSDSGGTRAIEVDPSFEKIFRAALSEFFSLKFNVSLYFAPINRHAQVAHSNRGATRR